MTNAVLIASPFAGLIVALILGTLLGIERTIAGKTAGLRTYGLVSMGACLFIMLTRLVAPTIEAGSPGQIYALAGIIMGIGFIGGGTIMHNHEHTSGLTTAAGLWVAAGIGATVGFGYVTLAILATVLTLIVFTLFWFLEHKVVDPIEKKLK